MINFVAPPLKIIICKFRTSAHSSSNSRSRPSNARRLGQIRRRSTTHLQEDDDERRSRHPTRRRGAVGVEGRPRLPLLPDPTIVDVPGDGRRRRTQSQDGTRRHHGRRRSTRDGLVVGRPGRFQDQPRRSDVRHATIVSNKAELMSDFFIYLYADVIVLMRQCDFHINRKDVLYDYCSENLQKYSFDVFAVRRFSHRFS